MGGGGGGQLCIRIRYGYNSFIHHRSSNVIEISFFYVLKVIPVINHAMLNRQRTHTSCLIVKDTHTHLPSITVLTTLVNPTVANADDYKENKVVYVSLKLPVPKLICCFHVVSNIIL